MIDPETGLDAVRDVGIRQGRIACVSEAPLRGGVRIDASGLVLAPGFIDMHSHAQTLAGLRLQALDGVTTALELEVGAASVAATYALAERRGCPINVGYSASWTATRARLLDNATEPMSTPFRAFLDHAGLHNWRRRHSPSTVGGIVRQLESELHAGALGVGVALGYAPETDPAEYIRLAALAARWDMPAFTHARWAAVESPGSALDAGAELVAAASETGAHIHFCHLNSTTHRLAEAGMKLVEEAHQRGARVSTEAYPYGSGCTAVGASFLDPAALARLDLPATAVTHVASGQRLSGPEELKSLREKDPGALVIVDLLDEQVDEEKRLLREILARPEVVIASDAVPPMRPDGVFYEETWPLPREAQSHPRTAGCFSRMLRWLVRETGTVSVSEAVRRSSLLPAQLLESTSDAFRRKGRVQAGSDADIVLFDPERITDRSSYSHTTKPSTGMVHVLVGGEFVVRDGALLGDALPGKPVYGRLRQQTQ